MTCSKTKIALSFILAICILGLIDNYIDTIETTKAIQAGLIQVPYVRSESNLSSCNSVKNRYYGLRWTLPTTINLTKEK